MPKHTPAQTRNAIRRALRAVVDPEMKPGEVAEVWAYFDSRCAYCGAVLDRELRGGQMDPLVPTTRGGTNHKSNRARSCGPCNGDEKRERDWREFLHARVLDPVNRGERERRIETRISAGRSGAPVVDPDLLERGTARALSAFDGAVAALRDSRS